MKKKKRKVKNACLHIRSNDFIKNAKPGRLLSTNRSRLPLYLYNSFESDNSRGNRKLGKCLNKYYAQNHLKEKINKQNKTKQKKKRQKTK